MQNFKHLDILILHLDKIAVHDLPINQFECSKNIGFLEAGDIFYRSFIHLFDFYCLFTEG
jgi:hypothetical protein